MMWHVILVVTGAVSNVKYVVKRQVHVTTNKKLYVIHHCVVLESRFSVVRIACRNLSSG